MPLKIKWRLGTIPKAYELNKESHHQPLLGLSAGQFCDPVQSIEHESRLRSWRNGRLRSCEDLNITNCGGLPIPDLENWVLSGPNNDDLKA